MELLVGRPPCPRPRVGEVGRRVPIGVGGWWSAIAAAVAERRPLTARPSAERWTTRPPRPTASVPEDPGAASDEERALVERARHDRGAFGELYRRHVQAVFGYAYRLTGSKAAAEDITSATFERALRNISTYRWQGVGVRPWLLRIAANEATDHHRRRQRAQAPAVQRAMRELSGAAYGEDGGPFCGTDPAEVRAALQRLPERYREVISLRYLAGLDATEAAAALGCSKATLAVTLHRALGALRRTLAVAGMPEAVR